MILTTVVYKTGSGNAQYARDMDNESKHDADRCVAALSKRFKDALFFAKQFKPGMWTVEVDRNAVGSAAWDLMRGFAEGFIASASLWER